MIPGTQISPQIEKEDLSKKIFVGGISHETTPEQILEYFTKFGKVKNCDVPTYKRKGKIKGFAFVRFHTAEAASKATAVRN